MKESTTIRSWSSSKLRDMSERNEVRYVGQCVTTRPPAEGANEVAYVHFLESSNGTERHYDPNCD